MALPPIKIKTFRIPFDKEMALDEEKIKQWVKEDLERDKDLIDLPDNEFCYFPIEETE